MEEEGNKIVMGIHSGHCSSVALIKDGSLDFALQEERLTRIKNQGGMPIKTIVKALSMCNGKKDLYFSWEGKDIVNYVWERDKLIATYLRVKPSLKKKARDYIRSIRPISDVTNKKRIKVIKNDIKSVAKLESLNMHTVDHHLCHASAAYYGWGKTDEKILIITCDGSGDGLCATVNIGYKGKIDRIAKVEESHSLGRLYANVTCIMGMVPLEHEYKIMGLAPYAEKSKESISIANELGKLFHFDSKNPLVWKRNGCPPMQYASEYFTKFIQNKRFDHIFAGLQVFIEYFLVKWVANCIRETGIRKVALSGGVFMNVKANQKILEIPDLEDLFVFPSCGDEANAIGAAYYHYNQIFRSKIKPLGPFYLGEEFDNDIVMGIIKKYKFHNKVNLQEKEDIEKVVAELLYKGEIVARFKGRMEFGARALGDRSILANPSNPKVVRIINEMIKNRDFWMPFAPSVIDERSDDYFIKPKKIKAPYMIITFDTKKEKRDKIIAAIHPYDFTGRPQEVYEDWNPSYYKLIKYFEELTGEGIILNTSFNLHGEPIVYSPEDALRVFDISGLKYLAIENFLLAKG